MDFDSIIPTSDETIEKADYDNRPIRPMDQEALNEVLARLPILVDDDDAFPHVDPLISLKNRRQPALAYSTRRKNNLSFNNNQSNLNLTATIETPSNGKRRPANGTTPTISSNSSSARKRSAKRIGYQQEMVHLKEEKQILEEEKLNSINECDRLHKFHESLVETIKDEHQQAIDQLTTEHQDECRSLREIIEEQKSTIEQTKLELENLRDDFAIVVLEKETLTKMVEEFQLLQEQEKLKLDENESIIKKLKEEISQMKENQQPKREINRANLNNNRTVLKETTVDRLKPANSNNSNVNSKDFNRPKINTKVGVVRGTNKDDLLKTPTLTINTNMIKSNPLTLKSAANKVKSKASSIMETETKPMGIIDKPKSVFASRTKIPLVSIK